MHDEVVTAQGQVAPDVISSKTRKIQTGRLEKITEEIKVKESSPLPDMQAIITAISRMDDKEVSELANVLSRRGTMLLLALLDPDNQSLLNLPEKKKRAALRLESMGEEQFREILSRIEGDTEFPQEEIDVFSQKTAS